jgi:hypothetical protein
VDRWKTSGSFTSRSRWRKSTFCAATRSTVASLLILLDNAAELLMARVLREEFAFADYFYPPGREPRLDDELKPQYSSEEREAALWEFEPKLRLLGHHLKKITAEERAILKICHRLRNETFHAGTIRHRILAQTTVFLFQTVVGATTRFPVGVFVLPGGRPAEADADFLARFEVRDAADLAFDHGRESRSPASCSKALRWMGARLPSCSQTILSIASTRTFSVA